MILLWALLGCHKPPVLVDQGLPSPALPPPPPPTGQLEGGWYVDSTLPLRIFFPAGWLPEPGKGEGSLRLRLTEPASGSRLEVHSLSAPGLPVHQDCTWSFREDIVMGVTDPPPAMVQGAPLEEEAGIRREIQIAHCTPATTDQARLLARCAAKGALYLCVESRPGPGWLAIHQEQGDLLLESLIKD